MRRVSQRQIVDVDESGVMKPGSEGDCFPACVASIFEIPLEQAPGRRGNTQEVWDWLALNFPGVGVVARSWQVPRDEPEWHQGYWIATVLSARFREPDCGHCTPDRRRKSRPDVGFFRRDECPVCDGTGHAVGLHAVVMEGRRRVWDPHPQADWDAPLRFMGEDFFVVTDPSRLTARGVPQPIARS